MKPIVWVQPEDTAYDTISERIFSAEKLAKMYFQVVRDRFLAINHGQKIAIAEKSCYC